MRRAPAEHRRWHRIRRGGILLPHLRRSALTHRAEKVHGVGARIFRPEGSRDFPLTQEFVAMMLGATRPTVTIVAGTLQRAGLITYHRGHVTIVDREKLEAASCECYRTATDLLKNVTRAPKSLLKARR